MIDTDKYEGHRVDEITTPQAGPKHSWVCHRHDKGYVESLFVNHATAALIADAPKLLAEVERLREGIQDICNTGTDTNSEWVSMALTKLMELIE